MKLDTKALRYLTSEDWRVLTTVEMGSKNHEIVPTPLIAQLSGFRGGSGVHRCISNLAKVNLIARTKNAKYDGYRLTYGGLDYLALHAHTKKSMLYSVGNQIGVGKESDIIVVASPQGMQHVLKIHRLGRISFRTVKANRDYLRNRNSGSWMYMSRLAALKEFTFMKALWETGFTVPEPLAQNRHTIVMELIDAFPLRQIVEVPDPAGLYAELMEMILKLASVGLIHGDFNEFNILVKEEKMVAEESEDVAEAASASSQSPAFKTAEAKQSSMRLTPVLIDFPQMVSISHANAEMYFNRDVDCIKRFFSRRFGFTSDNSGPFFSDAKKGVNKKGTRRLDVEAEASGFSKKMAKELESYMQAIGADGDGGEDAIRDDDAEREDSDDIDDESEGEIEAGNPSSVRSTVQSSGLKEESSAISIEEDVKQLNLVDET